jgi:hypothetical protein
MKTSVYRKVHRDILLEWVYDDNNFISESFQILNNSKDQTKSYVGGDLTANTFDSQLFPVDIVKNKWAKINTTTYNFLQLSNYIMDEPVKHDTIKLHFPAGFNFREYQGLFVRAYTYDYNNKKLVNLSNFFFDRNDSKQETLIDTVTPPVLYEDRLWDRVINIDIPSVNFVSLQRTDGLPTPGSINDVLTSGLGLSFTSPIFIDFSFISGIQTIGSLKTYTLINPFTVQVSQAPELNELQLYAQESSVGDYFEIYPLYNNTFDNYVTFISQSKSIGKAYYTEYLITTFEQNIKGRTVTYVIDTDFTEIIEWRPILKYSSTKVTIDIEMRLIDNVDGSLITRKASYGLTSNQISKYSLNLKKIKIKNVQKPKIYVKKNVELAQIDSLTRNNPQELTVSVDVPTLINLNNIQAFSENDLNPKSDSTMLNYHPFGQMKILIQPFDNLVRFSLATINNGSLSFVDLTNSQNLKICFRTDKVNYEFNLNVDNSNLKDGGCSFKIPSTSYQDLKNIYTQKSNLFYITTTNNGVQTVLYSGLFIPSDSQDANNIFQTNNLLNQQQIDSSIIDDPSKVQTAIATRKLVQIK